MTDDYGDFFAATPQLQTIQQWARARYAAPWAVFGAVLLRVAATAEPSVQLPGVIGGRASLNLLAAFVSPSGGGKGISDKVARLAWPALIVERPVGSGEGIAATFMPPKGDTEPITRAIINVPEVDTLAGLASRQGSILLAQLKSMAMGEQLGQSNASEATTRIIAAHAYRCCLSVGAQPGHTGVLFDDTTGGTPQRFLWFRTIDPDMPADRADDPDPLDTRLPMWTPDTHGVVEIAYGPPEIAETIVAAHIARQRGDAEALDGHAMLTRCKVAAVLAILHHRSVVSELDWLLSGVVMAESTRTREWIRDETKRAERQKIRARALARARGEEFVDERRLDVVKRRIGRILTEGPATHGDLNRRVGKREYRELLGAALADLETEGVISSEKLPRGMRYERIPEFNVEPEFNHDTPSSETLNREFNVEPAPRQKPPESDRSRSPVHAAREPESEPAPRSGRHGSEALPTVCQNCFVELPKTATGLWCDECDGENGTVVERSEPELERLRSDHGDAWRRSRRDEIARETLAPVMAAGGIHDE